MTARNRSVVSPMCMYSSLERDGKAQDYHLVHLGRFALGGAGIVITEATAIDPIGRITSDDLGIWSDDHIEGLARIASFLKKYGAVAGIQLSHAGRKAATLSPWRGLRPLMEHDAEHGDPPWPIVGPTAIAAGPISQTPHALSASEIAGLVRSWAEAARRATEAGFDVIELHGAHGYLIHSFLSPLSNHRTDQYGGSRENRMRFALEVVDAVRAIIPDTTALFFRVSAVDGLEGGVSIEDSITLSKVLYQHGVDLVDVSSGGLISDRSRDARIRRGFGIHSEYSAAIKRATDGPVGTVGLIVDPRQAEAILHCGQADLIFVAREMLSNPNWPLHAQAELEGHDFSHWHTEAGWWLERRQPTLDALSAAGETPLTGYESVLETPDFNLD